MIVTFIFIGEGTSDESLIPHLRELCMLCGAEDATAKIPEPNADLLFMGLQEFAWRTATHP